MNKLLSIALLLASSQFCAAQEVQCDISDAFQTYEADYVFNSCSDGTEYWTYFIRENDGTWPANTEFPIAGSNVLGLEKIDVPADYVSLLPMSKSQPQAKWLPAVWWGWLAVSGACYGNHHATIWHLGTTCTGRGGVAAISSGMCGMGSSATCREP